MQLYILFIREIVTVNVFSYMHILLRVLQINFGQTITQAKHVETSEFFFDQTKGQMNKKYF